MLVPAQVLQVLLQHQLKLHSSAKDVAQPLQFHGWGWLDGGGQAVFCVLSSDIERNCAGDRSLNP